MYFLVSLSTSCHEFEWLLLFSTVIRQSTVKDHFIRAHRWSIRQRHEFDTSLTGINYEYSKHCSTTYLYIIHAIPAFSLPEPADIDIAGIRSCSALYHKQFKLKSPTVINLTKYGVMYLNHSNYSWFVSVVINKMLSYVQLQANTLNNVNAQSIKIHVNCR